MATLAFMRQGTIRRAVILISAALLALAFLPNNTARAHTTDPESAFNPDLPDKCGINIVLLVDSSASISASGADDIEDAYFAFLNGLEGTGSAAAVVDFDTVATVEIDPPSSYLPITTVNIAGDFKTYIDGFTTDGLTNWEDALVKAAGFSNPDLVVLLTDGNPTTNVNGDTGTGDTQLVPAIVAANTLKSGGAHILAIGVGGSVNEANLVHVSGDGVHPPAELNADTVQGIDVILTGFSNLDDVLAL